ncbi:MAG: Insulinase (Peptidase M16) [Watsoniomyces obsoletus]|nr:MAG: Insulinase (Peptidase M16) [Watsoniomyces obsoletus]
MKKSLYRRAKPIPFELREHCVIYFEEQLYNQALTLLTQLVISTTPCINPTNNNKRPPAFIPPPQHLSLAATLIVHPSLTTHQSSTERLQASNAAWKLLHLINDIVGPIHADFDSAFTFLSLRDRRGNHGRRRTTEDGLDDDHLIDAIHSDLADVDSVWTRAEDFWHVVGWGFNSSIAYPKRWIRWKLWLELMLDVMDADWEERRRRRRLKGVEDEELKGVEDEEADNQDISSTEDNGKKEKEEGSLIMKYLPGQSSGHGGFRRVVRAVFADASARSMREFRPVFEDETKEMKNDNNDNEITQQKKKRPLQKINIDEGIYGDYFDDDDHVNNTGKIAGDGERTTRRRSARDTKQKSLPPLDNEDIIPVRHYHHPTAQKSKDEEEISNGGTLYGGMESVMLRKRFLNLVSNTPPTIPTPSSFHFRNNNNNN